MNFELFQFGNVTVAALILVLALLLMTGALQLLMYIGRFALSLDSEGAPKMLTENWLWDKFYKAVPFKSNLCKVEGGWALTSGFGICGREYFDCSGSRYTGWTKEGGTLKAYATFSSKEEALASVRYKEKYVSAFSLLPTLAALLLTDLATLWLQTHFMSAIWCISTAGIILTIRYLSGKVWNHNNRITVLEEK